MSQSANPTILELTDILDSVKSGCGDYEMYFYDDLPKMTDPPSEWEEPLVKALQALKLEPCNIEFQKICVQLLIRLASKWEGISGIIGRLVVMKAGLETLLLAHEYFCGTNWESHKSLQRSIVSGFDDLSPTERTILLCDSRIRSLMKWCRNEPCHS